MGIEWIPQIRYVDKMQSYVMSERVLHIVTTAPERAKWLRHSYCNCGNAWGRVWGTSDRLCVFWQQQELAGNVKNVVRGNRCCQVWPRYPFIIYFYLYHNMFCPFVIFFSFWCNFLLPCSPASPVNYKTTVCLSPKGKHSLNRDVIAFVRCNLCGYPYYGLTYAYLAW